MEIIQTERWQIVNISGFAVSMTTTQLCSYGAQATIDNMSTNGHGYNQIKFILKNKQLGQICMVGCGLLAPDLDFSYFGAKVDDAWAKEKEEKIKTSKFEATIKIESIVCSDKVWHCTPAVTGRNK